MPTCSIIIPVYNRASFTRQCLDLLRSRRSNMDIEIIVVDDGSRDLTPRLLAGYGQNIRVVTHPANRGFASACNDGAAVANGTYLVFLNNDTLPTRGWLDALVQYAETHRRAAVVGSKLLYPDDSVQHAGVVIAQNGFPNHIYGGFPADHPAVNKSRRFQAVTGACMLVRRSAFEEIDGFDETFHNHYEDVDLCLRLGQRGYEVHYCHESVLYHLQSLSRTDADASGTPSRDATDAHRAFMLRWARLIQPDEVNYYLEDGLISFVPAHPYPISLSVSPLLAVIETEDRQRRSDELISKRTRQVYNLMQENTRLEARLRDIELRVLSHERDPKSAQPTTWMGLRTQATLFEMRNWIGGLYLQGNGIEIGALHSPLKITGEATVRYVDRMSTADLRRQYPELADYALVEPDIIDDGERLSTLDDASQDFVIANHYLEHCQDPIGAIMTMLRVLKPGGVIFMAIPDKRFTFDRRRPVTSLDHLVRDHEWGPAWSKRGHFEEWVSLAEDDSTRGMSVSQLLDLDYSIHFHVWTQTDLVEFFTFIRKKYALPFSVEFMMMNQVEVIVVLRRDADGTAPEG